MSLAIIQSGTALQLLDSDGTVTTLTLPTGVTLRSDVAPRWAIYGRRAILVNTPSQPLTVDNAGVVRLLCPRPPRMAPVLTGPNAGGLTGTYTAKMTHVIQDVYGNLLAESDYSPASAAVTVAAKSILASTLDTSPDQITGRRLYRTTTNGAVYFQWVDLDGNVLTSVQDDLADAGLALTAGPILGTPPRLTTIAEFRGRLWGTSDVSADTLRYTEAGVMYAWPSDNALIVPGAGTDLFGVSGLIPRRDALGVGRRNMLIQIVGSGVEDSDGLADFDSVVLSKELGVESQETVKVYRDTAYFLWKDGVYSWNSEGIRCLSDGAADGRGAVRSWFATDDYFNRDRYQFAFADIDPNRPCYRLFLSSVGSTAIDSWVEYDIKDQTWWGPHSTSAFTPASAFTRTDASNRAIPAIGSASAVYIEQETRTDGASTAISMDVVGKRHDFDAPDHEKYFGQISVLGKAQASGTLSVVSRVGSLNATSSVTQSFALTNTRQRLGRLGVGKHAQVEFTHAVAGIDVELYGYDITPVHIVGRR